MNGALFHTCHSQVILYICLRYNENTFGNGKHYSLQTSGLVTFQFHHYYQEFGIKKTRTIFMPGIIESLITLRERYQNEEQIPFAGSLSLMFPIC